MGYYERCELLATDAALQGIDESDRLSQYKSTGWIHKSLGVSRTKGCPGSNTEMSQCTSALIEKKETGERVVRWSYPSDQSADGSLYALTHQTAQLVELDANGNEMASVWVKSNIHKDVRNL